jgi:hypothetical protein
MEQILICSILFRNITYGTIRRQNLDTKKRMSAQIWCVLAVQQQAVFHQAALWSTTVAFYPASLSAMGETSSFSPISTIDESAWYALRAV